MKKQTNKRQSNCSRLKGSEETQQATEKLDWILDRGWAWEGKQLLKAFGLCMDKQLLKEF